MLTALYVLALNLWAWLPKFVGCVTLTTLLAWALWLNFSRRR